MVFGVAIISIIVQGPLMPTVLDLTGYGIDSSPGVPDYSSWTPIRSAVGTKWP
mgnify:FL=1